MVISGIGAVVIAGSCGIRKLYAFTNSVSVICPLLTHSILCINHVGIIIEPASIPLIMFNVFCESVFFGWNTLTLGGFSKGFVPDTITCSFGSVCCPLVLSNPVPVFKSIDKLRTAIFEILFF